MDVLTEFLRNEFALTDVVLRQLLQSIILIVVLIAVRFAAMRFINRRTDDVAQRYLWRKWTQNAILVVGVFLLARTWLAQVGTLATYLGLATAGVAIALRDPIVNLAGWAFLVWRRPFHVGDRIEIGPNKGDVVDISFFQFTLLEIGNWVDADQNTGRFLHVPNQIIFSQTTANFTEDLPFIWHELPVTITFASNWEKAKRLLQDVLDTHVQQYADEAASYAARHSGRLLVHYGTLTPIVYTSVAAYGVVLTMRLLCPPRRRRGTAQLLWEEVLRAFARADDIELAYPTQRIVADWTEHPAAQAARAAADEA